MPPPNDHLEAAVHSSLIPLIPLITVLTGAAHATTIAIAALTSLGARTPHRRRDARKTLRLLLLIPRR
ncbi:hypothetical protein ACIOC1_02315 [Streptomyces sp. NPDC088197]|uniref:hypothetical protein n=1 Tax=Streptomyces sp. NPDC088197 TaxID=3365840 RepID=UPI0038071B68